MTEPQKEKYPEESKLLEMIAKSEPFSPIMRRAVKELFNNHVFRAVLREILVNSDDMLKNVGLSDLTNNDTIQKAIRQQGVAAGLSQAVETICTLAATPEEKEEAKGAEQ